MPAAEPPAAQPPAAQPPAAQLPGADLPAAELPDWDLPADDEAIRSQETQPSPLSSTQAIRTVLHITAFRRLWYATALSSLGDWLGLLATTALATSLAGTYRTQNYALGGVLLVRLLPAMLLGPLAGVFADRFDRRRTMVVSDALRFLLFVTIPIAPNIVSKHQSLTWLYIATFLVECIGLFWMPAKDASVPNLMRKDQVEAANQLGLVTTYGITPVLGAILFSVLSLISSVLARHLSFFKTNSTDLALYFNALTFLVGALVVLFIREISGRRRRTDAVEKPPTILFMIREGASFVRSSRLVSGLVLGILGAFAAGGAVIGAGRTYVTSLGGGNAEYGVLFGSLFVGLGSGMAFGPRFARELSRRRLFGLSIVFGGVSLGIAALMPHVSLAVIFVVGVGFGAGLAYLCGVTLLGTDVEDELRGRVFALLQSLLRIVLILALASVPFIVGQIGRNSIRIGGWHFTLDGTRIVLFSAGLLAIAMGLWAYRRMDDKQRVPVFADLVTAIRGDQSARRRLGSGGLLIAFEGGEGAGKTTQIAALSETLRAKGISVLVTHEPGATEVGEQIRKVVLHTDEHLAPRAEALLFAADRAHHVDTVIRPALEAGEVVLTDRFVDSSVAYQGVGRDLTQDEIRRISRWATGGLNPDLVVLLDVPVEVGLARVRDRGAADRLEAETLEFHERVRQAYRSLAEADPRRYLVIDATLPRSYLAGQIAVAVDHLLASRPGVDRPEEPAP